QVFDRFRELENNDLPGSERELDELLLANDPLVLDRLPREEAMRRLGSVRDVVDALRDLNEPRSLGRIRAVRIVRVALLGILVVGLFAWLVVAILRPTNIALHKPAMVSSVHALATGAPTGLTYWVMVR